MKGKRFFLLFVLLIAAMAMAGCAPVESTTPPTITGVVNSAVGDTILVVEGIDQPGVPQEEWSGNRAIYFTITGTTIIEKDGEPVSPDDFTGLKLEIWADGDIAESYPEQAKAGRIVILEDLSENSGGEEEYIESGRFAGLNGDTITVKISGVPDEISPREYRLSAELLESFADLALEEGENIKFTYIIDEAGKEVIIAISKIGK